MMDRARRLAVVVPFACLLVPHHAAAHRDDYINETFVFQTLGAGEFEPELTVGVGRSPESGHYRNAALSFEYGITEHWMVDAFAGWIDPDGVPARFDRFRAETRQRYAEEGRYPVDVATSFEVEAEREPRASGGTATSWSATGRLVVSKDLLREWNVTLNLDLARAFDSEADTGRWTPGYAVAARYPREGFVRYGAEFRQDFGNLDRVLAVPQVWFAFPHDATLKVGYRFDPRHAESEWALVSVFEVEL